MSGFVGFTFRRIYSHHICHISVSRQMCGVVDEEKRHISSFDHLSFIICV